MRSLPIFRGIAIICATMAGLAGCGSSYEGQHSIASLNFPDNCIRHRNGEGWISKIESETDKNDATFNIVPGLADKSAWSFESVNFPGMYLRHRNARIQLETIDAEDAGGKLDATFKIVAGLADTSAQSFESVNFTNHFIKHSNARLSIARNDNTDMFKNDATFRIEKALLAR